MNSRVKTIKRASIIGILGNSFLAIGKIVTGLVTGSLAILGDGFDTATDIITSIISLVASKIIDKPPDKNHPYGHGRIEIIATQVISFVIFYAGIELARQSISRLISKEALSIQNIAIIVSIVSIAGKFFLAFYKFSAGKKINSQLLIADAKNMRNDVVLSAGVLVGLLVGKIGGWWWVDSVTALAVSVWIIKVSLSVFLEGNVELMEGHNNFDDYREIFFVLRDIPSVKNPHKVRIRRIGIMLIVDLDIEVDKNLSVKEGHDIATAVKNKIMERLENIYDVQVHVEPEGNKEDECYGITHTEL